jgi:23S rRNA (uracil1939-C5)-methyltransferase
MTTPGEAITVTVERPAVGGAMIARDRGRILLVTGAIPGERVRVRIDRVSRKVAFATTIGVDEPSPDRRPGFDDPLCGGCLYGHVAYERQLALKRQVVADAFARIGRIPALPPFAVVRSPEDGYRMRARLHVRGRRIGFFREGTHEICDPRRTRQLLPATCDVLDRLGAAAASLGDVVREVEVSENVDASQRTVHFETSAPVDARALASLAAVEGLTPPPFVTDVLAFDGGTVSLRRHVQAFFQGNRYLLRDLVEHVVGLVPEGSRLLDLYAGVGLFSVAAAVARAAQVTAVEGDRAAAADLEANASLVADRLDAVGGDVETFVRELSASGGPLPSPRAAECVIVDPPRSGLSPEALAGVIALRSPRLIYVSCDVATLARDARRLLDGGYCIDAIQAFDLFPNTPHVETVVVFIESR